MCSVLNMFFEALIVYVKDGKISQPLKRIYLLLYMFIGSQVQRNFGCLSVQAACAGTRWVALSVHHYRCVVLASAWGSRSYSGRRVGHIYRANTLVAMILDKILQFTQLTIACSVLVPIGGRPFKRFL